MPIGQELRRLRGNAERLRHDHEPESQGGQHRFGEGPHVDHPTALVECLERFDRLGTVAEIAIVVVLYNRGVVVRGPGNECPPARQRHRHAERKLVRWGDVHEPGLGRECVDDKSFIIDGHRRDPRPDRLEQQAKGEYPGSSTATRSRGFSKTRAMMSTACCVPLVTMMSSATARTPRDTPTRRAIASRRPRCPAGSP